MGMRGIGSTPKRSAKKAALISVDRHPWDKHGLSRAERVICFIETLPVTAGPLAGTTLRLRPWQKKFIRAVYRADKTGNRLIRTAVLSVARKNGKTQLAAVLCLCALSGPEQEPRGECYSVACTRFQAGRVFSEMVAIITRVPWLNARINIVRFRKELEDMENGSTFAVLAADVAPVHGLSPSFVCYDELAQVPSRALYDALGTALGGRAQPLMVVISTQAATDTAPMSELIDYGLRIERGEIVDSGFHLTFYTAPIDCDPWKLATWRKANPALGDFRSLEDVKRLSLQAQHMPSAEVSFRNLILNQRVDTTEQFINAAAWTACGEDDIVPAGLRGRPCYAGLDLGATRDLTALVLVFLGDHQPAPIITGDSGVGVAVELRGPRLSPFQRMPLSIQPYAFGDAAWAWTRGSLLEDQPGAHWHDPRHLKSVGAGVRGEFGDRAAIDMSLAVPIDEAGLLNERRKPGPRFLLTLTTRLLPWS